MCLATSGAGDGVVSFAVTPADTLISVCPPVPPWKVKVPPKPLTECLLWGVGPLPSFGSSLA